MKLKKFLKNFCIDEGINERVDILIFDKMRDSSAYSNEGVPNIYSALVVASENAGTLYAKKETENVFLNALFYLDFEKCLDPMAYLLNLPVRMVCMPKNDNAAIGIIVEEYEPSVIMHKETEIRNFITDGYGKIVSDGKFTDNKTFIKYNKKMQLKTRKNEALKAATGSAYEGKMCVGGQCPKLMEPPINTKIKKKKKSKKTSK